MQIDLSRSSEAKLDYLLEELATRYNMEELTSEKLLDALLDLGTDLIISEEAAMPLARGRLIEYCSEKMRSRL